MSAANVAVPHAKVNFSALGHYTEYAGVIKDVWSVLGRSWTNLMTEAEWSNTAIPGGEHGELKIELTDGQREALMPLLTRMQFFQGCRLRGGNYTELEITGAKFPGMVERVRMVIDRLTARGRIQDKVSFERIIFQVGHRPRQDVDKNGRMFDGRVAQIYRSLSEKVKAHPWVVDQMKLMDEPDATEMWKGAFTTEYLLGILAFIIATDGEIEVVDDQRDDYVDNSNVPGIPPRTAPWCELILPDGTPVFVLNGPVDTNRRGAPRPTTTSNTAYRLEHFPPIRGGKIVTVSGKVHWYRVIGDFERKLHATFPDITVYGLAQSANDQTARGLINNALGEVVNLLQKAVVELNAITG